MDKNNFKASKAAKNIENSNVLKDRLTKQGSFENTNATVYTTPRKTTIGGAAGPARPIDDTKSIVYEKQPETASEAVKPALDSSTRQEIIRQNSYETARTAAPVLPGQDTPGAPISVVAAKPQPRYGDIKNLHEESKSMGTIGGAAGDAHTTEHTQSIVYDEKRPDRYSEAVKPTLDNSTRQEIIRQNSDETARTAAPVLPRQKVPGAPVSVAAAKPQPRYGDIENLHEESKSMGTIGGAAGDAHTTEHTQSIVYDEKRPDRYSEAVKPTLDSSTRQEIIRQSSYETVRTTAPVLPRQKVPGARMVPGAKPQPKYGNTENPYEESQSMGTIGGAAGAARTTDNTKSIIQDNQPARHGEAVKPTLDSSTRQEIIRQNSYETARTAAPVLPRQKVPGARISVAAAKPQPRYGNVENPPGESRTIGGAAGAARTTDNTKSIIQDNQPARHGEAVKPTLDSSTRQEIIRQNSYETARTTAPVLLRQKVPGARMVPGARPQPNKESRIIGGAAGDARIPLSAATLIHKEKTGNPGDIIKPALDVAIKQEIIRQNSYVAARKTATILPRREVPGARFSTGEGRQPRYGSLEAGGRINPTLTGRAGKISERLIDKNKSNTEGLSRPILKERKEMSSEFIKDSFGDTVKDAIIKSAESELYAGKAWGIKEEQSGVLKIIGGIAAREIEAAGGIGIDDDSLTGRARGLSAKYGYKAGKYAVQGGYSIARGAFRIGRYTDKLALDVANGVFSPKEARLLALKRTGKSIAGSGGSIKKILKDEAIKGIEDFHGSDDLGMQALTKPKDVIVKTRRTVKVVSATGKAMKKGATQAAKGTKKIAHKTVQAAKYITGVIKKAFSSPVVVKGALIVALVIICMALLFAIVTSVTTIIPAISLKSDDKELAKTYQYITKLDADLSYKIRRIPDEPKHNDVDNFHFYMNGSETSADGVILHTNADMMLLYFDCKYDDYAFDKFLHGFFGGTNIKDEVNSIHDSLYSYTTNRWEERIRHRVSYRDENGKKHTETWIEIIIHLDILVSATSFDAYLMENIDTLLTQEEQERMAVIKAVGLYTAKVCLGSPFKDENYYIATRWGYRIDPGSGTVTNHQGINIPKPGGTPINNVMYGKVQVVGSQAGGYGNCVIVEWGKNAVLYGYMDSVEVTRGQMVGRGDIIGYVGSTGQATDSSLYLEYYIENGFNTNPAFYLTGASYTGGTGSTDIVQVAASQIGNVGGQPYWSWYGFSNRVEWCACFVSWCANECGYIESGAIPKFAACASGVNWFKDRGLWQPRSTGYVPQPGDIIFFDFDRVGVSHHVGIVESSDGSTVTTIEGNSGNACRRRTYSLSNGSIMGYGTPLY